MQYARRFLPIFALLAVLAACENKSVDQTSAAASKIDSNTSSAADIPALNEQEAALIAAAVKGDTDQVKALLDKGTNVDVRDGQAGTPLGHAAWFGHGDTVQVLIARGADVNARKKDGTTPWMLAMANKHPDVAAILKQAGGN